MISFINVIKATRVYRILPVLMIIFVSAAFAEKLSINLFYLALTCFMIYSAAGLHNAMRDKDYKLPKSSRYFIFFFASLGILISLQNHIVLLTSILWIGLGFVYNTVARKILLGDSIVLAITHFALPSLSSSLILGIDMSTALRLTMIFFLIGFLITQTKNLKDTKEDKERDYATLTTRLRNGRLITLFFLFLSYTAMSFSYILFGLGQGFIFVMLFVFLIMLISLFLLTKKMEKASLNLLRVAFMVFMLGLMIHKTSEQIILSLGEAILIFYLSLFIFTSYNLFNLRGIEKCSPE